MTETTTKYVFNVGTIVTIKILFAKGVIRSVELRGDNNPLYEVSYFVDGERRVEWFNDFEFDCDNQPILKIKSYQ